MATGLDQGAMPAEYLDSITTGDARELASRIPDESIDLIFTDPVYERMEDYEWLAETAMRVLKPDSAVLVWYAIGYKDRVMDALRAGGLRYKWDLSIFLTWSGGSILGRLVSKKNDCFWFEKGSSSIKGRMWDVSVGVPLAEHWRVNGHKWAKDPPTVIRWLTAFTHPDALVLDPFTGGGTVPAVCKMLGRHYIGFEIDPETAARARVRLEQTQVPLLVPEPEQLTLFERATL